MTNEVKVPSDLLTRYKLAKAQLAILQPPIANEEDQHEGVRYNCNEAIEFIERIARLEAQIIEAKADWPDTGGEVA